MNLKNPQCSVVCLVYLSLQPALPSLFPLSLSLSGSPYPYHPPLSIDTLHMKYLFNPSVCFYHCHMLSVSIHQVWVKSSSDFHGRLNFEHTKCSRKSVNIDNRGEDGEEDD